MTATYASYVDDIIVSDRSALQLELRSRRNSNGKIGIFWCAVAKLDASGCQSMDGIVAGHSRMLM